MSISPFKFGARKPSLPTSRHQKLTLSESLLITAGLAGLIGLVSGSIIRFSLSHSPSARFLSPLQTFPALSGWQLESPSNAADALEPETEDSDATLQVPVFERLAPLEDSAENQPSFAPGADLDSADTATFDRFTNRKDSSQPADPWETLKQGPDLGIVNAPIEALADTDYDPSAGATAPESDYGTENYAEDYPLVEEPGESDRPYYEGNGYEDNGQY